MAFPAPHLVLPPFLPPPLATTYLFTVSKVLLPSSLFKFCLYLFLLLGYSYSLGRSFCPPFLLPFQNPMLQELVSLLQILCLSQSVLYAGEGFRPF